MPEKELPERFRKTQEIAQKLFRGAGFATFPLLFSFGGDLALFQGQSPQNFAAEGVRVQSVNLPNGKALTRLIREVLPKHTKMGCTAIALLSEGRLAPAGEEEILNLIPEDQLRDQFPDAEPAIILVYSDRDAELHAVARVVDSDGQLRLEWQVLARIQDLTDPKKEPLFLAAFR
jgi:hypothetical protein